MNPLTFRRASQVGTQLASKVMSRGSVAGGSSGAIGPMSLPPARGFKLVACAPAQNKDGSYKHGGHVQFVIEPGDHGIAADGKDKGFGHIAMSNTPAKVIANSAATLLAEGKHMPPNSMNIYPGSGLALEPAITGTVAIHLGPLSDSEARKFEDLFAYETPTDYQRAGVNAHNCVTKVAEGLHVLFDIPAEKVASKPQEMPADYLQRIEQTVIQYAGRGELKKT